MKLVNKIAAMAVAFVCTGIAYAGPVANRSDLQTVLGGSGTIENFEKFNIGTGGATTFNCDTGNVLNASSTCNGQGPGLVNPGLTFQGGNFQWNAGGYFGSPSKELLSNGGTLTVDFNGGTSAFGLDLRAYSGYGATAQVKIFGLDDTTLIGTISGVNLGSNGVPVFVGWQDMGGIGAFSVSQTGEPWSPIVDNIQWGAAASGNAVPEPASIALLGFGLAGLGLSRRKKKQA